MMCYGEGYFCGIECRDKWHDAHPERDHGARAAWPMQVDVEEELKELQQFKSQQDGPATPGVERVDSQSSVERHFDDEPLPALLVSERANDPVTCKPPHQWECISCKQWYEQCHQTYGLCVQGIYEVCARCSDQIRPKSDHICKKCWITVGMIPTKILKRKI
jgi:hypothetical protein